MSCSVPAFGLFSSALLNEPSETREMDREREEANDVFGVPDFLTWYMEHQDTYSRYNSVGYETESLPIVNRAGEIEIETSGLFGRLAEYNVFCTVNRLGTQLVFEIGVRGIIEEDRNAVTYAQYHLEAVIRNDPLLKLITHGRAELEFEHNWNVVERFQLDISTCLKIERVELRKRVERRCTVLNEKRCAFGEIVEIRAKKVLNSNTSLNKYTYYKK